jgi:hypothetical protein
MKSVKYLTALAVMVLVGGAPAAFAGSVSFVENTTDVALGGLGAGGYVDVFYTPSPTAEYLNHDLVVTPTVGGILDPIRGNGGGQSDATTSTVDTWSNTVFELFVANSTSFVFTTYDPVGVFPTFVGDALPAPALNWSVFDTNTGDNDVLAPYHLARVLYEAGGAGQVGFLVFDTLTADSGGENFSTPYGVIPEPGTMALGFLGLLVIGFGRRKS